MKFIILYYMRYGYYGTKAVQLKKYYFTDKLHKQQILVHA